LSLQAVLYPATIGIFDSSHLLYDPSSFEESLLDTTITVVLNEQSQVLFAAQVGPERHQSSDELLRQCISVAKKRKVDLPVVTAERAEIR